MTDLKTSRAAHTKQDIVPVHSAHTPGPGRPKTKNIALDGAEKKPDACETHPAMTRGKC